MVLHIHKAVPFTFYLCYTTKLLQKIEPTDSSFARNLGVFFRNWRTVLPEVGM